MITVEAMNDAGVWEVRNRFPEDNVVARWDIGARQALRRKAMQVVQGWRPGDFDMKPLRIVDTYPK